MSWATRAVLWVGGYQNDAVWEAIAAPLPGEQGQQFGRVPLHTAGGTKGMGAGCRVYAGAFSHVDGYTLQDWVSALPWTFPEFVVLLWQGEDVEGTQVWRPGDLTGDAPLDLAAQAAEVELREAAQKAARHAYARAPSHAEAWRDVADAVLKVAVAGLAAGAGRR